MPALHRTVANEHESRRGCRKNVLAAALDDDADRFVEAEILDESMLSAFDPIGDIVVMKIDKILLRLSRLVRVVKDGSRIVVNERRIEF